MNQFNDSKTLAYYFALALFESMYPQLNSSCASKYENQWGEACSIATRLLDNFDRDNVHLISRMDDQFTYSSYPERIIKVGMYDNWNIISHDVRMLALHSYNDYESCMLDYARVGVATEFVRKFMR